MCLRVDTILVVSWRGVRGWRKGKFVATLESSAIVLVRGSEGQGEMGKTEIKDRTWRAGREDES